MRARVCMSMCVEKDIKFYRVAYCSVTVSRTSCNIISVVLNKMRSRLVYLPVYSQTINVISNEIKFHLLDKTSINLFFYKIQYNAC